MINVAEMLDLSIEEKAEIQRFEKELDKIMSVPLPVLHDSEISKIEETLVKLTQEMVERGRQPANKVNS
jgi:hypothetical protein